LRVVPGDLGTFGLKAGRNRRKEEATLRLTSSSASATAACAAVTVGLALNACATSALRRETGIAPPVERDVAPADETLSIAAVDRRGGTRPGNAAGA